jgi:hypothetical protein
MAQARSPSAITAEMREMAARARWLAHHLAPGEDKSRMLRYADELEEHALRIETIPTSDESR